MVLKDFRINISNSNPTDVSIRQQVNVSFTLVIPLNTSTRVILTLKTIDNVTNGQFADISDVYMLYAGCNVDGFVGDQAIAPAFTSSKSNFYFDTVYFDLGVVTNTGLI
jgi:hypothetical protein